MNQRQLGQERQQPPYRVLTEEQIIAQMAHALALAAKRRAG